MLNQMINIKIEDEKLKMEISIKDLVHLKNTDPNSPLNIVKPGKEHEFAEKVAESLREVGDISRDSGEPRWIIPLNDVFQEFVESNENFLTGLDIGNTNPEVIKQWKEDVYSGTF